MFGFPTVHSIAMDDTLAVYNVENSDENSKGAEHRAAVSVEFESGNDTDTVSPSRQVVLSIVQYVGTVPPVVVGVVSHQ
jgi:hypothetical protein